MKIKRSLKNILTLVVPLLIVTIILMKLNNYYKDSLDEKYNPAIGHLYDYEFKDKGLSILNKSLKNDDILLMGSSELSSQVVQNPIYLFPNSISNKNVTITGIGHTQSLLQAIKLGALDVDKDSNIAIVISLQWFMTDDVSMDGFQGNFSELQYYSLMNNSKLNNDIKKRISERVYNLTENSNLSDNITAYSKLESINSPILKVISPYFKLKSKALNLKNTKEYQDVLNKYKNSPDKEIINFDSEKLNEIAEEHGRVSVTNNDFYMDDKYYESYIAPKLSEFKNMYSNIHMEFSKEFDDLELLLDLCKDLKIKPYFVIASTNGYYYDFTGLTKDKRNEYYDRVNEIIDSYGFESLNLKDYEYEKYFYRDGMHLGWKGWLKVSEEMAKYFK